MTSSWIRMHLPAQVTGVGFFDFLHGQSGVAPNGIELHPVLSIAFGKGAKPSQVVLVPTSEPAQRTVARFSVRA